MLEGFIQEKGDQNYERQNGKKYKIYQQFNLKNKLSQQEQKQNHGYRERFDGCQMGRGYGGMGEQVRRLRSTNK